MAKRDERPTSGSVLVHNSKQLDHFVFGKESASGGGESIELNDLGKQLHRRRRKGSESDTEEESFIVHVVEAHHTLRGIALLYRSTVRNVGLCFRQNLFVCL